MRRRHIFTCLMIVAMAALFAAPGHATLVGHWKFEEGTGPTTDDSSDNSKYQHHQAGEVVEDTQPFNVVKTGLLLVVDLGPFFRGLPFKPDLPPVDLLPREIKRRQAAE